MCVRVYLEDYKCQTAYSAYLQINSYMGDHDMLYVSVNITDEHGFPRIDSQTGSNIADEVVVYLSALCISRFVRKTDD